MSPADEGGSPRAAIADPWRLRLELFALSFVALFLELMVIRWAPSVVRMVAYYANLMLISSFLGLGVGAILARQRACLMKALPAILAASVGCLLLARYATLPVSEHESRFFADSARWLNYLVLVGVFFVNAAVFVPLGQAIGRLFEKLPVLQAYAWDLGGSLAGTVVFGVFSLTRFSPTAGMAGVMAIMLLLVPRRTALWGLPVMALTLVGVGLANDPNATWSPYYYITIRESPGVGVADEPSPSLREPPANVRTMVDPPSYLVSVNHDFYQPSATFDLARYTAGRAEEVAAERLPYDLPYRIALKRDRVLVLGAGAGSDVEVAILNGASHVDAVEIDPSLVRLSRKFNPSGIYADERVHVHVDDARAFIERADGPYDMVVFGWLDSQALFSYMSSLRLDGYIYTVESIRRARALLAPDGVLSLSFVATQPWLVEKLVATVRDATGEDPIIYWDAGQLILCVPAGAHAPAPSSVERHRRLQARSDLDGSKIDVPTDDWPYLYLSHRTIPGDYLVVIVLLMAVSIPVLVGMRGRSFGAPDVHFLLLGAAFLLMQTKSISDCSLYFGTTWFVTMVLVAGVLLMVLAANLLAARLARFSLWLYAPVVASLVLLYLVPRSSILGLGFEARLAWSLLVVPLPIFFAGLIFSTTLRSSLAPAALLGANLIGAMIGGFCEYLGMVVGHGALTLLVIAAYLGSALCMARSATSASPSP